MVPNSEYLVRLHFGELSESANGRVFSILINDLPVEVDLDIFVRNGNVAKKALVIDYEDMETNAAGEFDLLFTNVLKDNALVNGIEIYSKENPTSTEKVEIESPFDIFYDKSSQLINISSKYQDIKEVALYNAQGQLILKQRVNNANYSLSGANLKSGLYIVNVISSNKVLSKKIIL